MDDLLFSQYDLRSVIQNHEQKMFAEIDAIDGNRLLNTSVEDLCDYFEQEYQIAVPQLNEASIQVDQGETRVDVSHDHNRFILDTSRPFCITGTKVTFYIPYQGDANLFKCKPSTFTFNPPRASVAQNEVRLEYALTHHDANRVKSTFERDLSEIRKWLDWIEKDVSTLNQSVRGKARQRIEARREKLLKDQGMPASLGFPLRRRENAPTTYTVLTVRRKFSPVMQTPSVAPFVPEPALDMKEYEHILSVISNMVTIMERSPRAFSGMNEEDLRQHFLVQLNGQY